MERFMVKLDGLFDEKWLISILYEYFPKFTYGRESLNYDNFEEYLEILQEHDYINYTKNSEYEFTIRQIHIGFYCRIRTYEYNKQNFRWEMFCGTELLDLPDYVRCYGTK